MWRIVENGELSAFNAKEKVNGSGPHQENQR
jgi:hypothetical protein